MSHRNTSKRTKPFVHRLKFEELESRTMLAGPPVIAMAATGITTGSYEDFYKSQAGTQIGGPAGVGMVDTIVPANNLVFTTPMNINLGLPSSLAPEAISGTGQMTITTGANTLGIGSFAMPTAGPSRAGGTGSTLGGTNQPQQPQESQPPVDVAIEDLFSDPDAEATVGNARGLRPLGTLSRRPVSETRTSALSFEVASEPAIEEPEAEAVGVE